MPVARNKSAVAVAKYSQLPTRSCSRNAARRCARDIDVARRASCGSDGAERQVEDSAHTEVRLADEDVCALLRDPLCEVVGSVDSQGRLVDPGVEYHRGDGLESGKALTPEGRGEDWFPKLQY